MINASDALDLKRKLFKKSFGKNSTLNQTRTTVADFVNKRLKKEVTAVKSGLREQEILFHLKPVFRRLRKLEAVAGLRIDIHDPIRSALRIAGELPSRAVSTVGEGLEKAGEFGLPLVPQRVQRGLRQIPQFLPQLQAPQFK